jgi:UDP-GlcNAc:undecaprenyl-phosphate GlcNAc-1-phosphate transferase
VLISVKKGGDMSAFNSELIAFMATTLVIYFALPRAEYFGLVDRPSGRKVHNGNIPTIGGIAIFFGFVLALLSLNIADGRFNRFVLPALLLIIVGLIDDMQTLSYKLRFISQIFVGILMTYWSEVVVNNLGNLVFEDSVLTLQALATPFTIICLVGVVNAVNMSDGVDGLAGMLALVALTSLALVTYIGNQQEMFHILLILTCCLFAFLGFNARFPWRKRAVVFMGDAGSMFLGFSLTWFTVRLTQGNSAVMTPVTPLWFIALPLFDMTATMLRRVLQGRSPFDGDREHLHHVFLLAGFSVSQTVTILTLIAFIFAVTGIAGLYLNVPEYIMFYTFLALFAIYFLFMRRTWSTLRFFGWDICRRGCTTRRRSGGDRRTNMSVSSQPDMAGVDQCRRKINRRVNPDRRRAKAEKETASISTWIKSSSFQFLRRSVRSMK